MAAPLLFREESKHNGGLRRAAVLHALIHITTRLKGVHWNQLQAQSVLLKVDFQEMRVVLTGKLQTYDYLIEYDCIAVE